MNRAQISSLLLLLTVTFIGGCTKQDSGSGSSSSTPTSIRSLCGTVYNGKLVNPIKIKDAEKGSLRYVGPNLVAIKTKGGEQMIKLHGLDAPTSQKQRQGSESVLSGLIQEGEGYFYIAEPDCTSFLDDGSEGAIGAVFSARGKSFSEQLIKSGNAAIGTDVCQGSLLNSCYKALEDDNATPTPIPVQPSLVPAGGGGSSGHGFILWKPASDKDGRLAVHSTPYGVSVRVKGEVGVNGGGGNGYGSLARFKRAGCSYGKKVKLELIQSDGSLYQFGTTPYAIVPDGCQRYTISSTGVATINQK